MKVTHVCLYIALVLISFFDIAFAATFHPLSTSTKINDHTPTWWKEAVVYQIYPRSFKDSNGDGIGDLQGVISKLDYLKALGVNVIWLSPFYDSPNVDNGYDVRDYYKIMHEFGSMADFDELLRGLKKRHMKLIIDLVVNHTSDEHQWFRQSRQSKNNPYRDFYIWRGGVNASPPNNYSSFFTPSAWQFDPTTKEYYLHYFASAQPDLNWDNPKVRAEVHKLMRFWLDKGVDGFRMDVIPFISKNQTFPNLKKENINHPEVVYAAGPNLHRYLNEMNEQVLANYDAMTVGEAFGISLKQMPSFVDERRHELNMIFNFDLIELTHDGVKPKTWTLPAMKGLYTKQNSLVNKFGWQTLFISNHDTPRAVSTFGDDSPTYRIASAKLLATMLLTLKGTPFIYQGDELGMTNYPFKDIHEFNDIAAKEGWLSAVKKGQTAANNFIAALKKTSRDHSRTLMQWDDNKNAGFTTASRPWFAINPNYKKINAKTALADPNSIYHYFQKLIQLRRAHHAFVYGDFRDLDPTHPKVFVFIRAIGEEKYLTVLNFSRDSFVYHLPLKLKTKKLLLSNLGVKEVLTSELHLKPWDARVYKL